MPSFQDLHLTPDLATALDRLGWDANDPLARETIPITARGNNLVAVTPPVPAYAAPALAGIIARLVAGTRALLLAPESQLDEWGRVVHGMTQGGSLRVQVAHGTARAMRRLKSDTVDLVIATPETALTLLGRSALKLEAITTVLLAWPESWTEEESIIPLMQDLPRESQRVIYTAAPDRVESLVERYARKAMTVTAPGLGAAAVAPVRAVSVPWSRRVAAVAELVELLDPASLTIWTADRSYHDPLARAASLNQPELHLAVGDAPPAATIVAFDLPTGERLQQLAGAGDVVLLVPPGTESYVARIANPRPLVLPNVADTVVGQAAGQRAAIARAIESGSPQRALLTLAPLFERYDPAAVAAALFELWSSSSPAAAPSPAPAAELPGTAKIYVGVGKKDGATANDLVAVLTKELRVDRTTIGRIELRDAYSLVEIPAQDAERVATGLNGVTIRRRRVTARVDRGPSRPPRRDGAPVGRPARRT